MQAVVVALVVVCGIELLLWLWLAIGWWRVARGHRQAALHPPQTWQPASIIVCMRNEATQVAQITHALLTQDYPATYEIVMVNDASTDDTGALLDQLAAQHPKLHVVHITQKPAGWAGKKYALTQGIAAAQYALVACTDADCSPGPWWLHHMMAPLHSGYDVVLGHSPYVANGTIVGAWQRLEAAWLSFQVLGWASGGMPYAAVGRSLAYTRAFFEAGGGVAAHAALPSGDDDLLIHQHVGAMRLAVAAQPAAAVPTQSMTSWSAYLAQRKRHLQTGKRYKPHVLLVLVSLAATSYLTLLLPALAWLAGWQWCWALWCYRLLYQASILALTNGLTKALRHTFWLAWAPLVSNLLTLLAMYWPTKGRFSSKDRGHSAYDYQ